MKTLIKTSLVALMLSTPVLADSGVNVFAGTGTQGHEVGLGYKVNSYFDVSTAYRFGYSESTGYHTDVYNRDAFMEGEDMMSGTDITSQSISVGFYPLASMKYMKGFKLSIGYIQGGESQTDDISYLSTSGAKGIVIYQPKYDTTDGYIYQGADMSQGVHAESEWEYDGYVLSAGYEQSIWKGLSLTVSVKYAPTSMIKSNLYMDKNDIEAYYDAPGVVSFLENQFNPIGLAETTYHTAEMFDDMEAAMQEEFASETEINDDITFNIGLKYQF